MKTRNFFINNMVYILVCGSIFYSGCNQPPKASVEAVPAVVQVRKGTTLMITGDTLLSPAQQDSLLAIARRSLQQYLMNKTRQPDPQVTDSALMKNRGCMTMVTLDGKVRGASGYVLPIKPLAQGVNEMAGRMAGNPGQSEPLTIADLPKTTIVLTVISDPIEIKDPSAINPGKSGLVVIKDGKVGGVLLPEEVLQAGNAVKAMDKILSIANSTRKDLTDGKLQVLTFTMQRFSDALR